MTVPTILPCRSCIGVDVLRSGTKSSHGRSSSIQAPDEWSTTSPSNDCPANLAWMPCYSDLSPKRPKTMQGISVSRRMRGKSDTRLHGRSSRLDPASCCRVAMVLSTHDHSLKAGWTRSGRYTMTTLLSRQMAVLWCCLLAEKGPVLSDVESIFVSKD